MNSPPRALTAVADDAVEAMLAQLRRNGGRATAAKRLLLRALLASHDHRSAEQLAGQVQAESPDVHLTTIYRNLDELERLHLVERTYTGHGPATYHLTTTPHGHLACQACGTITEIPATDFANLATAVQRKYGFTISPGYLALAGHCSKCGA